MFDLLAFRNAPLVPIPYLTLDAWCERAMDSLFTELYHVNNPMISAPDVSTAAKILTFQVEWLFTHNVQGDSDAAQSAFRNSLFQQFRIRGRVCNLTSLNRLLQRARSLNISVYDFIILQSLVSH